MHIIHLKCHRLFTVWFFQVKSSSLINFCPILVTFSVLLWVLIHSCRGVLIVSISIRRVLVGSRCGVGSRCEVTVWLLWLLLLVSWLVPITIAITLCVHVSSRLGVKTVAIWKHKKTKGIGVKGQLFINCDKFWISWSNISTLLQLFLIQLL